MRALFMGTCFVVSITFAGCREELRRGADDGLGGVGGLVSAGGLGGSDTGVCAADSYQRSECEEERLAICQSKSDADCEKTNGCQLLSARPIDSVLACFEAESRVVGCGVIGCGGLYTVGKDADGKEWLFPSTCLPAGFTTSSGAGYPSEECAGLGGAGGAGGNGDAP